ncbi:MULTISPECIES: trimeric intracellular cation channel family protein [unclassified Myxococcus]|uniref:trimeric intracellular cation channel family protein n=1 Tax=Myxococcus TaxID=32 RepID=UPI001CBFE393|nr:TRIC cation channel family protein [Myxococcus sp. AS-1-15]MBZ4407766.1 TRIC cation channel family protein [Myxococcus sp. XM-1-1-1]BDT31607.1 TRIC cation channel family protein [Myxococcus sp. MH1]
MYDLDDIRPYLELTSVAAGAVSGALHAQRRTFDFVGVVVIGIATGLGGGIIRDVMLGQGPALALRTSALLITAAVAALLGALFGTLVSLLGRPLWVVDTLSLGLFTAVGLQRAQAAGLDVVPSLFLGVVTGVGGGVVRDVLCRETPVLLLSGQPYSVAALFAGSVYLTALRGFGLPQLTAEALATAAAFSLRLVAAWRGWMVPPLPDLPRALQRLRRPRPGGPMDPPTP